MDGSNGRAHFYVNNSSVSVSGTTSAAAYYQVALTQTQAAAIHSSDQPRLETTFDAVGYAQSYDSALNDLIDRNQISFDSFPRDQDKLYFHNFAMPPTAIAAADSSDSFDGDFSNLRAFDRSISTRSMKKKSKNPQLAQQQRRQANMRERRRMKSINHAFDGLRQKIPTLPYEKKLSKVDTLKLAINYIQFLKELIDTDEGSQSEKNQGATTLESQPRGRGSSRTQFPSSPPAKIIIECRTAFPYNNDEEAIRGHSLSWSRAGDTNSHSLMTAKVWRPQHPQQPDQRGSISISNDQSERRSASPDSSASSSWYEKEKFPMVA